MHGQHHRVLQNLGLMGMGARDAGCAGLRVMLATVSEINAPASHRPYDIGESVH